MGHPVFIVKYEVSVSQNIVDAVHGSPQVDHRGPHFLRDGVQVHDGKGVSERLHAGGRLPGLDHGYDTEALVEILKFSESFLWQNNRQVG